MKFRMLMIIIAILNISCATRTTNASQCKWHNSLASLFKLELANRIQSYTYLETYNGYLNNSEIELVIRKLDSLNLIIGSDTLHFLYNTLGELSDFIMVNYFKFNSNKYIAIDVGTANSNGYYANVSTCIICMRLDGRWKIIDTLELYQSNPYQFGDLDSNQILDVCKVIGPEYTYIDSNFVRTYRLAYKDIDNQKSFNTNLVETEYFIVNDVLDNQLVYKLNNEFCKSD